MGTNGQVELTQEQRTASASVSKRGVITKDAETTALVRIFKELDRLQLDARRRVLTYVAEKYIN